MLDPIVVYGALRVPTYSLSLTLALALTLVSAVRSHQRTATLIDVGLAALLIGLIGARLEYVLLAWGHFAAHPDEIARLDMGGLGWHGAVIGGYAGMAIMARWRGLDQRDVLRAFAWALPLLAAGAWIGCGAAGCAYGREVDTLANYPAWLVWEARDVYGILAPRYNTAGFGVLLSLIAALVGALSGADRRFWTMLALISAGMFGIGFIRADASPLIAALRADQLLDVLFFLAAVRLRALAPVR